MKMSDNFDREMVFEAAGRVDVVGLCASWYIGGGAVSRARACLFIVCHISLFIRL